MTHACRRFFAILPLLGMAGCAAAGAPPPMTGPVALSADTRGMTRVGVGQPIEIRLRSSPSTGYEWVLAPADGLALAGAPETMSDAVKPGLVGQPATQIFRLRVTRPGRVTARFSYDRPWTGGEKGARTTEFELEAR